MAAFPEIRINKNASMRRESICEEHDCVIVDDFLKNPTEIVDFAALHADEFSESGTGYPGLLFDVNSDAMARVYLFIRTVMTRYFSFLRGGIDLWTFLSIVTLRPEQPSNLQRICHTDPNPTPGRTIYAALIYLFENEDLGGTNFYRWNEFELRGKAAAIEREDPDKALTFLQEHFPTYRKPACYMTGSNELAERICTIPARFNRLIFYWGGIPHSGNITAPELLTRDIRKGRLTLNAFASVLPK